MADSLWADQLASSGGFRGMQEPTFLASYLGIDSVRLALIRLLRERGSVTIADCTRALGWTRNGLKPHLEVLEDLGVVEQFVCRIPGVFKPTRCYRLDADRLDEISDAVGRAVRGSIRHGR